MQKASGQTSWLNSSRKLLNSITKKTHNKETASIALRLWESQLQPRNPLWKHTTAKPFSINNNAHVIAMLDPRLPNIGIVGFFGCEDVSSGSEVLLMACNWLKGQGIKNVYGPINGTITKSYRLNLSDNFRVPGEPVNPLFYVDAFRDAGFKVFNQYVSGMAKHYRFLDKFFIRAPKDKLNLALRAFSNNDQIEDLKLYHELMNQIFPSQSIYCPIISWEERSYNMADKDPIFDSRYSYFLEDDGKPVGMLIAHSYQNKLCVDLLGVLPEYRGRHVSGLLIKKVHKQAAEDNLEAAIYALIRVGNHVYRMKHPGVTVYRRYITLRKQI